MRRQILAAHLLSVAFYSGAYVPEKVAYEQGEWTRWRVGEARHVRYQGAGSGAMEWWMYDDVPGDMVMYRGSSQGEGWVAELKAYGDDASR